MLVPLPLKLLARAGLCRERSLSGTQELGLGPESERGERSR